MFCLNNCFDSLHVVVRFTHDYRDFIADNDYAIFIQIPGLFKRQSLKNVFLALHVLRNRWFKPTRIKAAYSVTMNIFRKKYLLFKSFAKVE